MCAGAGELRWQQPCPDGVLRELVHPCPNGCGDGWHHPNAESQQVIEVVPDLDGGVDHTENDRPARRPGRVDQVNTLGGEFVATALEAWGFTGKE